MSHALKNMPLFLNSRKFAPFVALLFALCFLVGSAPSAEPAHQFQSEREAQQHCPNDTVVWLNTRTGVYHFKGQRWYGATRSLKVTGYQAENKHVNSVAISTATPSTNVSGRFDSVSKVRSNILTPVAHSSDPCRHQPLFPSSLEKSDQVQELLTHI